MNNEVKAELVRAGIKHNQLARQLRVSNTMISLVVSGKKKSARIRLAIAKALGMKVEDLWPNGNNNHRRAA
ncbi:MAG: helix-turn-helix transcriptional regulator [Nitrospiraceae bacterium]|nr:helix-turn-helix transcriptional regulator [Nitrospiraceae bacterium]